MTLQFEMPVPKRKSGSNMPKINWLDYAENAVARLRRKMTRYIDWFNTQRPHSSLQDLTPQQAYWSTLPNLQEVA